MPPPMPGSLKRMTANPARPVARYRPGKATQQDESSDEDEYDEEVEQQKQERKTRTKAIPRPRPTTRQDEVEDDDEEGFVTDEDEELEDHVPLDRPQQTASAPSTAVVSRCELSQSQPLVPAGQASEEQIESSEEDESSEEESSSEDEAPRRKFQRPTFIKKANRDAIADSQLESNGRATSTPAAQTSTTDEDEQLRRRAQAELLIQDKLERDALARAAGKKSWDDDDDLLPEQVVDDTDGLDPEAEYQAWKLRELKRLKRDRESLEAREREIEELERRRNLTAAERDREDEEFIAKQKAGREDGRTQATYMARYHHKGAFFQDDETAELLKKRDIMGARFADDVQDKSVLPEYMRIRDMTKLGKKGRTRYTDLKGQDTGRFGEEVKRWKGVGDNRIRETGNDRRDIDERFLPDTDRPPRYNRDKDHLQFSRRSRSRSPRRRRSTERAYTQRRRSYSSSRSRSPPRRKRSPSPYRDRDKRRRMDV